MHDVNTDERGARAEHVRNAFSKAMELEAGPFNLKGRGHEPRATLKSNVARILNCLKLPYVSVSRGFSKAHYYPLRLIARAAQLLDIDASQLTSTIDLASDGPPRPRPATWTASDGTIHRRLSRRQVAQLLKPGTRITLISWKHPDRLGSSALVHEPRSESKVVISATSKGFVCDDRPRHVFANTSFGRFDDIFFDLKRNIITIRRLDPRSGEVDCETQYRIETELGVETQ